MDKDRIEHVQSIARIWNALVNALRESKKYGKQISKQGRLACSHAMRIHGAGVLSGAFYKTVEKVISRARNNSVKEAWQKVKEAVEDAVLIIKSGNRVFL